MKLEFTLDTDYGRGGPKFYYTNVVKLGGPSDIHIWGKYASRCNGPGTAMAHFCYQVRWPSNSFHWFGYEMLRHFEGQNAAQQARAWLNYMATNYPFEAYPIKGPHAAPDLRVEKGGQYE